MGERERLVANLIINELLPRLERARIAIEQSPVSPSTLAYLASLKHQGSLSTHQIRQYFNEHIPSLEPAQTTKPIDKDEIDKG